MSHLHCDEFELRPRIIKQSKNFCEHSDFVVIATELYSNQKRNNIQEARLTEDYLYLNCRLDPGK